MRELKLAYTGLINSTYSIKKLDSADTNSTDIIYAPKPGYIPGRNGGHHIDQELSKLYYKLVYVRKKELEMHWFWKRKPVQQIINSYNKIKTKIK